MDDRPCRYGPVGGMEESDAWVCGDCRGCDTLSLPQTPTHTQPHGEAPSGLDADTIQRVTHILLDRLKLYLRARRQSVESRADEVGISRRRANRAYDRERVGPAQIRDLRIMLGKEADGV